MIFMEDILKFLFVAIVLGVAFVQHIRKETAKKASKKTLEPAPDETIPERQRASMSRPKKNGAYDRGAPKGKPVATGEAVRCPDSTMRDENAPQKAEGDYSIRSVEEARRAMVWSEILARKY